MLNIFENYLLLKHFNYWTVIIFLIVIFIAIKQYWKYKKLPPGPMGLPFFGYLCCLCSEPHKMFFNMRQKYGNIIGFRFGSQYYVLLNEFNVAKEILSHVNALSRDPDFFHQIFFGFGVLNGEEWVEQRRFSIQTIKNLGAGKRCFDEMTQNSVEDFMEDIETFESKPLDITEKLHYFSINNVTTLLFGKKFHTVSEKHILDFLIHYSDSFVNEVQIFPIDCIIPGFSTICESLGLLGYRGRYKRLTFTQLFRKERKKHQSNKEYEDVEDFINLYEKKMKIMNSRNERHFYNEENFLGNLSQLYLGSTDTIFNSLSWLIIYMVMYPNIQVKVQEELDQLVGPNESLNYEDRFKVPYTFAVILESQRMSSIVPLGSPRITTADIEIKEYIIPKGSVIITNLWGIHHDPNYWKNPQVFSPERFLKNETEIHKNIQSFAPFSMGRRNCPGEFLALRTIFLFFTKLLQYFEINVPEGTSMKFETNNGLLQCPKPQKFVFKKREIK